VVALRVSYAGAAISSAAGISARIAGLTNLLVPSLINKD
jgi:hypothetical protein